MFEKLMNSKINTVADWIIRLVMVNIMIILFSLPVITIYPAVSAGYNMFHDYENNKNPRMFRDYFKYFKQNIGKKILLGLIIVIIFFLGYMNIRYYTVIMDEQANWFNLVGYYATLALLAVSYAVTLYSFVVVRTVPNIKILNTIKISFFLAGKFYITTLALVVISSSPVFLLFHPLTSLIFVFMGISIPLAIHAFLTRPAVSYLENLGEGNG